MNTFSKIMLVRGILEAYHKVESELRKFLKPYGISLQQYNVLKILNGAKAPLSTSVIRERMIQPMTDTSRLVDRMSSKGWVLRVSCSTDKRLVDVTITPEGEELLNSISSTDNVMEKLYKKITPHEAFTLNQLLNKMRG